jgi:hypothetical protein
MRGLASVALLVVVALGTPAEAKERVLRLKLGPFRIEAKRDREVCQAFRIPKVPGMDVVGYDVRSRTFRGGEIGTHHFVAYGYRGVDSAAFPKGMVDNAGCNGYGPDDFYVNKVFIAGSGGETRRGRWLVTKGRTPFGLVQRMPTPADDPTSAVVVLNSHYFNVSDRPGRGYVRVTIRLAPSDPTKRAIRMLNAIDASYDIMVPPGARATETATWQADGTPNPEAEGTGRNPAGDVCVLWLTGHMHKRGVHFRIDYEEGGQPPRKMHEFTDYVHPGLVLFPQGFLLRAYTAENGWPRFRYTCTHANDGTAEGGVKQGCEMEPNVAPGIAWREAPATPLLNHARPCGEGAVNCQGVGTGRCVDANLVFGALSDDDMCIMPAAIYDPKPGVPPDRACDPF